MGNSESRPKENLQENTNKSNDATQWKAVGGNTEEIQVSSPKPVPNVSRTAFDTTSSEANFTQTENLVPTPIVAQGHPKELSGGLDISSMLNKLSSIFQDTEMEGGLSEDPYVQNKLSKIKELLQETETNTNSFVGGDISMYNSHFDKIRDLLNETEVSNNFVGGSNENQMINKIRDLLLQETETNNVINFKGGALDKSNLFSEKDSEKSNSSNKKKNLKK